MNQKLNELNEIPPKNQILALSIPLCIIFALFGMDFIGYFQYILSDNVGQEIYTRSLLNVLIGFTLTTLSLFVIPWIINKKKWKLSLSKFGSHVGNKELGIKFLSMIIFLIPLLYFSTTSQDLINAYPLTKDPLQKWYFFVLYELLYVIFYYLPYEFFFRGFLQLGLSKSWKKWQSILFVTCLTTLLHLTKPVNEIIAAALAGIVLGVITEKTDSWYYAFILHISVGIFTDIFCGLRFLGILI